MTPRQMFENMGYKYTFIGTDDFDHEDWNPPEQQILYEKKVGNKTKFILFDLPKIETWFFLVRTSTMEILNCPTDYDEIRAINEQWKELGWV